MFLLEIYNCSHGWDSDYERGILDEASLTAKVIAKLKKDNPSLMVSAIAAFVTDENDSFFRRINPHLIITSKSFSFFSNFYFHNQAFLLLVLHFYFSYRKDFIFNFNKSKQIFTSSCYISRFFYYIYHGERKLNETLYRFIHWISTRFTIFEITKKAD